MDVIYSNVLYLKMKTQHFLSPHIDQLYIAKENNTENEKVCFHPDHVMVSGTLAERTE